MFTAAASSPAGAGPLFYQWRRNGVNLSNGGSISGATSATLTINPAALSDNGSAFDCVVTNTCGSVRSNPAGLAVVPSCLADIAGSGPSVGPDGELTADDIILFISRFTAGC